MKGKAKLARIVGMAGKIVGAKQDSLSDLYLTAVERKTARNKNLSADLAASVCSVSEQRQRPSCHY